MAAAVILGSVVWTCVRVHELCEGQIKPYKNGLFLFGWVIMTAYARKVYFAKVRRTSYLSDPYPSSRTRLTREWFYAMEGRRFSYSFVGLEIFWAYRFLPVLPWNIRRARAEFRRDPATWFPADKAENA